MALGSILDIRGKLGRRLLVNNLGRLRNYLGRGKQLGLETLSRLVRLLNEVIILVQKLKVTAICVIIDEFVCHFFSFLA